MQDEQEAGSTKSTLHPWQGVPPPFTGRFLGSKQQSKEKRESRAEERHLFLREETGTKTPVSWRKEMSSREAFSQWEQTLST